MKEKIPSVLVIDDDTELCELVGEYLKTEGFCVELIQQAQDGVKRALSGDHVLVILDVMLPGLNGFEALRQIRRHSSIPVLMLTARGEEIDRIVGLEIGADDYLPKPFNPRELAARIRAILRRVQTSDIEKKGTRGHVQVGDVSLDRGTRTVSCKGVPVQLTAVEFELLDQLMLEAGNVTHREQLVEKILERPFNPLDRSIDMHVSNLRRKLGPHPDGNWRIKSVRSVGYIYTTRGETGTE